MRLCVLGPLEVVDGGVPVPLGGAKERTVLAVLAVNAGEVVSDSRLLDALWGDEPPRTANKTLQNYVLRLRKVLHQDGTGGAECLRIETAPPGYRLQVAPGALDAHVVGPLRTSARAAMERGDFEHASALLAEALGHWRGPALDEFADQPFALAEAARLDGVREAILEDQIDVALELGRYDDCISDVEALLTRYPLRERLWGQLMLALYRAGRQADALRAYQRARSTLVEQLGIEPGPALRQLEQAIIEQHPSLDGRTAAVPPAVGPGPGREAPATELPPDLAAAGDDLFVGRHGEVATLVAAWERARAGQRQAVFLGGEPGIGKTTLARALAWRVHEAGGTVLYGRNDEDLQVPYQPFAEAIRWYTARGGAAVLEQAGPSAAGLVRLVPELAARLPGAPDTVRSDPDVERQRLFEAVAGLVTAAAAHAPLLLVLDDLHWAATPTLLLLRALLRATLGAPVLVLGTYRDTELTAGHPLAGTLAALSRDEGVQRLTVCGLAEDEAVELVARHAGYDLGQGGQAFARSLHAETGGNPFFLDQMLRHLVETQSIWREDGRWTSDRRVDELDLPTGVRDLVGRRLARLCPDAQRAVAVGAIVGPTFAIDLLERVPGTASSPDELLDALDEAVGAMVLAEVAGSPGRYVFAHALVRQVVLSGLTATRRARLHLRVGEAIEALPEHEQEQHLGALARHFTEACEISKAVGYSLRAGGQANERLAFEQAVGYFEGAVGLLDGQEAPDLACRADLLIALGEGRALTGDRRSALDALGRAAADARALGSAPRLARIAMASVGLGVAGRPDEAVGPLCDEALRALGPEPSALRSKVMARLAMHRCLWANEGVLAGPIAQDALDIARQVGDRDALHLGLLVRALTLVCTPQVDDRLALAEELVASAESVNDVSMQASGLRLRALARLELGDMDGFDADVELVVRLSTALRRRLFLSEAARWRGLRALFDGRFSDFEQHAAEMLAQAGDDGNARTGRAVQRFFLWRDQGRIEEARQLPEAAVKVAPGLVGLQALVAWADAELGRTDEAQRAFDAFAAAGFSGVPHDFTWTASLSVLTELCAVLGDRGRAGFLLELFRPHSGHLVVMGWGDVCPGAVDRYLAILAAMVGRWPEAEAWFESALALEERVGSVPAQVRTKTSFGRMLLDRAGPGDSDRARPLLDDACAGAERLGMVKAAAEARCLIDLL